MDQLTNIGIHIEMDVDKIYTHFEILATHTIS